MKKDSVTLHCGDCLDVLASLKPNSIDACVTDPPYHLTTPGHEPKKWEAVGNNHGGGASPYRRTSTGFMGKAWDGGDIAFRPEMWREVHRVLKPGGHILAFGGTRTYHRMACAIEDAGFEIRDCVQWLYGSGFPKSHNVAIGIDKASGAIGHRGKGFNTAGESKITISRPELRSDHPDYKPYKSVKGSQWEGWGTALKPANEPICLARKPLSEKTVAANVLRWGTGAINVDGCRVETQPRKTGTKAHGNDATGSRNTLVGSSLSRQQEWDAKDKGRWPANVIHDGSEEVVGAFPWSKSGAMSGTYNNTIMKNDAGVRDGKAVHLKQEASEGSAARFFYCAKASKADRAGSKHPTVKPIKLIRYLIRLITPPKGVVLDPFAGTGTTGAAAVLEGARAVLIEREREYIRDIRRRLGKSLAQRVAQPKRGRPIRRGARPNGIRVAA